MVNLKLYKQEDMNTSGQDDDDIAVEEPPSNIAVEEPTSNSAVKEPMCNSHVNITAEDKLILLMFVDEEIVNNVEEGKQLVTEEDVQTKPEQLPGMLLMRKEKLEDVYKYMDDDAITTLHAILKTKEADIPGAWVCQDVQKLQQMDGKWYSVRHVSNDTILNVLEQLKTIRPHGAVINVIQFNINNQKDKEGNECFPKISVF